MSTFKPYDSEQVFVLPPSMWAWLPRDHVVWFVREAVQILDLSELFGAYRGTPAGRPAYSPRMLTAVWAYAHRVGIRSSRKLERALHENIAFRVLSGSQQPDFWTLNAFRTTHRKALGDLLVQTVQLAHKLGLAPMKQVAVDGTRIQANTQTTPEELTADAGYFSERNICETEERLPTCNILIPPDRHKHGPPPEDTCAASQADSNLPRHDPSSTKNLVRQRMPDKLATQHGQERYKLRRCSVEPVSGQIKSARGLRQFLHRGLDKVRDMWRFECAVHNLTKIFRHGKRLGSQVSSV